ncbi:unnamed protein product [Didymodactylos carnosus]|nr:unnamed protein product [Didymodactylos carnosus]CAF4086575.1 unnamed protein product [Didymodactylos carnosus]
MDFHGPITPSSKRGNKYIITITDVLSKFVIAKSVRDCSATTVVRFLKEDVITKFGTPKCILTDNGTHFTASLTEELFKQFGVVHLYTTPYHPQTNGQIERFNSTMDSKIGALSNQNKSDWDEQLSFVIFSYNTSIHSTTKEVPFKLLFGRVPVLPFDHQDEIVSIPQDPDYTKKLDEYLSSLTQEARNNIANNQARYKIRYDSNRQNPSYRIGDLVLIKSLGMRYKFDVRYEGPFRIIQQNGQKTFVVEHVKKNTLRRQVTVDQEEIDCLQDRLINARLTKNQRRSIRKNIKNLKYFLTYDVFEPLNFTTEHVTYRTTEFQLQDYINKASNAVRFFLDTESIIQPHTRAPNRPALIQIQIVHPNESSLVLLFETKFMPRTTSPKFTLVQQLFKTILTSKATIHSWGSIRELDNFVPFGLFDESQILNANSIDQQINYHILTLQSNCHCELCSQKLENDPFSLQDALVHSSRLFLNKQCTISKFDCGLDPRLFSRTREQTIHCKQLSDYAAADCLAIQHLFTNGFLKDIQLHYHHHYPDSSPSPQRFPTLPLAPPLVSLPLEDNDYEMISDDENNNSTTEQQRTNEAPTCLRMILKRPELWKQVEDSEEEEQPPLPKNSRRPISIEEYRQRRALITVTSMTSPTPVSLSPKLPQQEHEQSQP